MTQRMEIFCGLVGESLGVLQDATFYAFLQLIQRVLRFPGSDLSSAPGSIKLLGGVILCRCSGGAKQTGRRVVGLITAVFVFNKLIDVMYLPY